MKQRRSIRDLTLMTILLACFLPVVGFAQSGHGHNSHAGQQIREPHGKLIREITIDGYRLTYRLIDMRQPMKEMEMPALPATHHLMLHLLDVQGNPLGSARVGFLIRSSSKGSEQKVMAMGMGDGYGADIDLADDGKYSIYSKAVIDGQTVMDKFTYKAE